MAMILRLIKYWLPLIFWITFIFFLSSRQSVQITGTFSFDFFIFKSLHIIEYGILYFLVFRALYSLNDQKIDLERKYLYAFLFAVFYAASDELHQTFTATRQGRIRDIAIDTLGIFFVYFFIKQNIHTFKKYL